VADLASVHGFAQALSSRSGVPGLLVSNAGAANPSLPRTTDGFGLASGTSHLGHFALTGVLRPVMLSSPKVRVITVTSLRPADRRAVHRVPGVSCPLIPR
jgi:NAD(P)-dependent dehydrogenase (short-subunit alcohol dehydrogenase family)